MRWDARSGENEPVIRMLTTPSGPLPRPGWRALILDAVLALALGLLLFQGATDDPGDVRMAPVPPGWPVPFPPIPPAPDGGEGGDLGAALLVFVLCAPLLLRRRYPLAVLWANIGPTCT